MEKQENLLKWTTLFDSHQFVGPSQSKKTFSSSVQKDANMDMNEIQVNVNAKADGKSNKRLSVERIYQKKTQIEHVLLRPDTYIGSVENITQQMWVVNEEGDRMEMRDVSFVPGLYKIFDEILVNAADNKVRDPTMDTIKIDIDVENKKIRIWNNGKGVPVVEHKTEKMYVPTLIFGHLLTSSNYDDSEKKVTGGRNGYGAKLCNIFCTKFIAETSSKEYSKSFKQTWTDNMSKTKDPTILEAKEKDFTCITFCPDVTKFGMTTLDKDIVAIFTRRAYDIAASTKGIRVFLNGKRLPVKTFRDYMDLYLKDKTDEAGQPVKVVYEQVNPRWEVGITLSDRGFQQVSFVNSIATTKGGRHVDYVAEQCVAKLMEIIKRKNKDGIKIMPFQVRSHLWVFVNCLIENPTFDSQTKENMTKQSKSFGSKCQLSDKFVSQVNKCGIVESVLSWVKFKAQSMLNKKCQVAKHSKLRGIPKLDDANDAGTKNSERCTLILTEGDSAKTLAVAGLSILGRDSYGVFPLRGKLLNVREATHKQILDNAEINNIIKIMGLHFKETYESLEKLRTLRYGRLMIMTDQDQDGSHIKGLLINFIHHFWPNLLQHNIVEQFITPIVKVVKGGTELSFFSLPEFEEWKRENQSWHTWKVKYYKGLGTSTSKEAKEYFSDMPRHRITFHYGGGEDDASLSLAFSKKKVEERKEWLTNYMQERKRRTEIGLSELYMYTKDTKSVTYNEFINRELILFSNMDNVRSIPSIMDGFKPGQRKVVFTCIKRNLTQKELKVAQLAGSVAEKSAYHHGEQSLMSTIIGLAQDFVGSNNLNILLPIGQFGTRLHGGKDAASARYIFTMLSPLARHIVDAKDEALLLHLYDDNQRIEPEWYCPIIPMVLVNGAEGIGTGWSTKIPNYDVRQLVGNIKRLLSGREIEPMVPSFKNFRGTIEELGENKYVSSGEVAVVDEGTVEITELPVRTWTQNYKEDILEPMLLGTEKTPPFITDYKEYHTDVSVKFVVKMTPEKLAQAEQTGLHKVFKLQCIISSNLVLFDHSGCIKKYDCVTDILQEYFDIRLEYYDRRKRYLEGMLAAEALKLDNIARFILEKTEFSITIENKPRKEIVQMLVRRDYDSDPVKSWKESQSKDKDVGVVDEEEDENEANVGDGSVDFNYILQLPLWSLTKERIDGLLKQRADKKSELDVLTNKTVRGLWTDDLEQFCILLDEVEEQARMDAAGDATAPKMAKFGKCSKNKPKKALIDTMPSPTARRVLPHIDTAMKLKVEKALLTKKTKAGNAKKLQESGIGAEHANGVEFGLKDGGDTSEPLSLADRLRLNSGVADTMKNIQKLPAMAGGRVQKKATLSPSKGRKGVRKHKPWSDSDEDVDSEVSDDLAGDQHVLAESAGPVRERVPRRTAASKVKYHFEDDDCMTIDNANDGSDSDDVAPAAARLSASSGSEDIDRPVAVADVLFPTGTSVSRPASKTNKQMNVFDSDDTDGGDHLNDGTADMKGKTNGAGNVSRLPAISAPRKVNAEKKDKKCAGPGVSKPRKKKHVQNEDFDMSESHATKKPKLKKIIRKVLSDIDDDADSMVVSRRTAGSRAKAPAKYDFGDSEDEDFGF